MKIVFIGDVVGKAGRQAVSDLLPALKRERGIDFTIANVENAAGGFGITDKAIEELEEAGVDFFTSGNHIWDRREGIRLLDERNNILRPANYPPGSPGNGYAIHEVAGHPIAVINIQGRVFMPPIDCPFHVVDEILERTSDQCRISIVDMHGEATSEKVAMGWHLDGRVTLVAGTHTHIPTRDCRILPGGTGYITDVGMAGSYDSVIGMNKDAVIERFKYMRPVRFSVAKLDIRCDLLVAEIDDSTGSLTKIEQLQLRKEE